MVPLAPSDWHSWLRGSETQARALLTVPDTGLFDPGVTQATDDALRRREEQGGLF